MQWLIANMWMALAAATFLGLLFGFSFRGLMVGAGIRKARVEREIARTELSQVKTELEDLYAAQRKRKENDVQAVSGDDKLQAELADRESRIAALGADLSAARAELDQLKASGSDENIPDHVAALSEPADGEALTRLQDRNTWLEERVAALEADLSAAPAIPESEPDAAPEAQPAAQAPGLEKLVWKTDYLTLRNRALEAKVIAQASAGATAIATPEPVSVAPSETPIKESEEELARLRWRNRYLEGRLAYFEEGEGQADLDTGEPDAPIVADSAPATQAPAEETSESERKPEPAAAPDPAPVEASAPEPESDAPEPAVHPSEAMLAELEGVQPEQIGRPSSGGDDLTAISGIGPRIAEVLNDLGIWTYAQIASWTPDNATWVENHLSFKGRVGRENWVDQAKELLAVA